MKIKKYTVKKYANECSMTVDDVQCGFSKKIKTVYADDNSAVAGCEFEDGTFGCFGCKMDCEDLASYDEVVTAIKCGM